MPGATTKVDASEYDLTHKISPFLDAHLVFPLLEFLEENTSYDAGSVQRARLELLAPTNMVDYAIEIRSALGETDGALVSGAPSVAEMEARRDAVFEAMEALVEGGGRLDVQTYDGHHLLGTHGRPIRYT